jgi:HAD superfamily hydrolase (TIGR01662 family)
MRVVFFDWDDTLNVHDQFKRLGEKAAVSVIEADLTRRQVRINSEIIHKAYKSTEAAMFSRKEFDRTHIWQAAMARLGIELSDEVIAEAVEQYWKTVEANSHLMEDAAYVLKELRKRGYRLGIIADYDDRIRDKRSRIERSSVGGLFDVIVLGGLDHPTTKPNPSVFSYACERMGCEPSEAVMVGDSPSDSIGAEKAGMASVIVSRGGPRAGRYSVRDLRGLLSLLSRIDPGQGTEPSKAVDE